VPALLGLQASRFPDRSFLTWEPFEGARKEWTYAGFARDVERLACGFLKNGVREGDCLLIHLDNCPEAILAWYACARIGAIAVTTNTRASQAELSYFATVCRPVAAITQAAYSWPVEAACPGLNFLAIADPENAGGALSPEGQFASLLVEGEVPSVPADPLRRLSVQFTSGTTARPKAVVWTHANALWGGERSAAHEGLIASDVHYVHLPLFHTNAQVYSVLATLWTGASMVLVPKFSASRFWDTSLRNGCTWSSMIPFCVKALLSQAVPAGHKYRIWAPAVSLPEVEAATGIRTMGWWGMTETVTHGIVGACGQTEPRMSIGRPAAGYEVAVLAENGDAARPGETGELLIRGVPGVSLFLEYMGDEAATRAAYNETGFMITGDRVTLGMGGELYFADRAKDMLKVGGENVSAAEVERVVAMVAGVREAAVVGKPHPMLDEVPVAFIIPEPGVSEERIIEAIYAACAAELADFKRVADVKIVKELPRSTLEKVAKADLRRQLREEVAQ